MARKIIKETSSIKELINQATNTESSVVYLSHNVMDWFQQEYGENWMKAVSLVLESHVSANKLKEMKIDG